MNLIRIKHENEYLQFLRVTYLEIHQPQPQASNRAHLDCTNPFPHQNIQDLLMKADILVESGVKAVWTIEPFTNTIFVTTKDNEERFSSQEIESEGIKVDFRKIFSWLFSWELIPIEH